jgi:CPA2 family monovalent cation:H+ antiporter-2
VPETLEASLQLSAFVLESMGLEERMVDNIIDNERALFESTLGSIEDGAVHSNHTKHRHSRAGGNP